MPKTTLAGHPLHPQLIVFPAGLLPFSLAMDALNLATGKKSYADASYYTMVGGLIGGLAAGAAGAADYLTIPRESRTKRTANIHAVMNIAALGLTGLNLLLRGRRGREQSVGTLPAAISLATTAGLLVSQWYGGQMSYTQGMQVRGVSEVEGVPDLKLPFDDQIEQTFLKVEEAVSAGGGPATADSRLASTARAAG